MCLGTERSCSFGSGFESGMPPGGPIAAGAELKFGRQRAQKTQEGKTRLMGPAGETPYLCGRKRAVSALLPDESGVSEPCRALLAS
jgi:hypothetical protein